MGNTTKDEAERLADKLAVILPRELRRWGESERALSVKAVNIIASVIREAIEARDRILTDMLSDSEAFHEGWRQGAKATLSKIANYFKTQYRPEIVVLPLPEPPSQTGTGEVLRPSDLALRAQRMELALQEILKFSLQTGDSLAHPLHLAQRIAREALEE